MYQNIKRSEFEFLIVCARKELTADCCERAQELVTDGMDWELLLKTAATHGILPFLYHHILVNGSISSAYMPFHAVHSLQRSGAKLTKRTMGGG